MKTGLSIICVLLCLATLSYGQVGKQNVADMNALLKQYGGDNVSPLHYEATLGLVNQEMPLGYSIHFTFSDIKDVEVVESTEGYTVQLMCDKADPCIGQVSEKSSGTFLSLVNFYFTNKQAAESFAKKAIEIIQIDFSGIVKARENLKKGVGLENENGIKKGPKELEKEVVKSKPTAKSKEKDHLSLGAYGNSDADVDAQNLSAFGKKLTEVLKLAEANQLDRLKGSETEGVNRSKLKLPNATKNYINEYKGSDCFVAEFGTKKYYEDLEDLYYKIKDEIDASIPSTYEPTDMAYESVYENSDDPVFHTEYYNVENPAKPSIIIRITPDGDNNTLFMRIGKR